MLDDKIRKKLESIRDLPTIPIVISEVLSAIDNPKMSAANLASIIERDQALTARVLRVANSPFYGFARTISTIDLAIVVMGFNTIKEIVLSLVIQRFFSKVKSKLFDINSFWHYGVFCGSTSRHLARKLGYKLAGEAFVAGLMHDIGVLIFAEYFSEAFKQIKLQVLNGDKSLIESEMELLNTTHCEVGGWIAEKWNLPPQIVQSIRNHHTNLSKFNRNSDNSVDINLEEVDQPLTSLVSMSEWFSDIFGFKSWINETKKSEFYLSDEIFPDLSTHDILDPESAIFALKQEILEEYQKANIFIELKL
jgi:HD-like signal output (HDOD) protein